MLATGNDAGTIGQTEKRISQDSWLPAVANVQRCPAERLAVDAYGYGKVGKYDADWAGHVDLPGGVNIEPDTW